MCKANYVNYVKRKMCSRIRGNRKDRDPFCRECPYYPDTWARTGLDGITKKHIIILTYVDSHAKATCITPAGHPQSASSDGAGPVVWRSRVFRFRRFDPSQIRDASSGANGGTGSERGSAFVWFFPAIVLPGASRLQRVWIIRFAAAKARTAKWPQIDSGGDGICRRVAERTAFFFLGGRGQKNREGVSGFGSSPQHRPPAIASKKTALIKAEAVPAGHDAELIAAYEQLRSYVLGSDRAGSRAPGLGVFLQRGMKAWMNVCRGGSIAVPIATEARSPSILPSPVQNQIAQLIAGMLLGRIIQEAR